MNYEFEKYTSRSTFKNSDGQKFVLFSVFPQIASTSDVSTLDADETLNFLSECGQNVTLSVSSLLFY